MRILPVLLLLLPLPALAQVSTNTGALDTLAPAPKADAPAAAAKPVHAKPVHAKSGRHAQARATRPAALPVTPIPAAPPPNPVLQPPPFVMPAHKPPPPPPVPVKPDAVGTATAVDGATRITFGPGTADLNPGTVAALRQIAEAAKARPDMQINVTAWAPGTQEDPSTPRRISLDRALAARAVLINAGLVSDRIHAIAKGFNDIGTAAPDRVDVAEILPPPPKPAGQAAPPPPKP